MGYFNIDNVKTIIEARELMNDKWMDLQITCTTTGQRRTVCGHMTSLYKKFPELSTWWEYDSDAYRYDDMFIPKNNKRNNSYVPITGNLPKLNMPCANTAWLPEDRGLYFIGMIGINPNGTKYYLVKVGSTENISKRIKQYGTYNPMIYIGGIATNVNRVLSEAETTCHEYIANKSYAYAQNAREWFYVDEEVYFELCQTFADKEMFKAIAEGRD